MNATNTRLRAAVIGVGAMGRHHARVYTELPQTELVAVS
ncbi:MAG: gfo/Idh/MocA family oxidoreductase, partial [Chloroflexota bacterium]|nr:gfo/Idh/MocA family oxidoreductase [Chloroflexota bacterium]